MTRPPREKTYHMPLPKKSQTPKIDPKSILLTSNGLAELAGVHRVTVMRALSKTEIEAAAWVDWRGTLAPLFSPSQAIVITRFHTPAHLNHPTVIC